MKILEINDEAFINADEFSSVEYNESLGVWLVLTKQGVVLELSDEAADNFWNWMVDVRTQ